MITPSLKAPYLFKRWDTEPPKKTEESKYYIYGIGQNRTKQRIWKVLLVKRKVAKRIPTLPMIRSHLPLSCHFLRGKSIKFNKKESTQLGICEDRFHNSFKLVMRMHHHDQEKTAWFETDKWTCFAHKISLMWPHIYSLHDCGQPTCHPLHKQVVVVLLTGCPKHPDDVGVAEETHHANLLS